MYTSHNLQGCQEFFVVVKLLQQSPTIRLLMTEYYCYIPLHVPEIYIPRTVYKVVRNILGSCSNNSWQSSYFYQNLKFHHNFIFYCHNILLMQFLLSLWSLSTPRLCLYHLQGLPTVHTAAPSTTPSSSSTSILHPPSPILNPPSILHPPSSILHPPSGHPPSPTWSWSHRFFLMTS